MQKFCRCLIPAILLFLVFQGSLVAEPLVVRVGAFNNSPVIFKDTDGQMKGLYVDLLKEIGQKENIRFDYVFGTWQDGLDRIKTGDVDLLTSVGFTEERALYLEYCQNPLLTVWGELYTPQSSEINSLLEISGKKVGVLYGDINSRYFQELTSAFNIDCQIVEFPIYNDVFVAIAKNEVDAGVAGVTFGATNRKNYSLKSTGVVFNPMNIFFATAKGNQGNLRQLLDKYLDEWKHQENSVLSQAVQKWLYGSVGAVAVMPAWLVYPLVIAAGMIALAVVFIVLLRFQVKRVTDRIHQREKSLQESEQKFKAMVETVPVAIHLTVGVEQVSEYLNPTMVKLFGYTIEEIRTVEQWWPLAYPDEAYRLQVSEEWTARIKRAIETQTPIEPMEVVVTCKDGSKKDILWGFITMGDKNYSCGLDLTDRKRAEEKVKALLAEKELLLREVHHRIKNNMNTIKGLLELQISAETDPSVLSSLRDAESRVQSIIMLYDRLYCTENYRELSVRDYLESLVDEIVGSFPSSAAVTIRKEIDDRILGVQVLTPVGIIVNELVTNVMKHAFAGRKDGQITISASFKDGHAMVVVQDDGIGMPESMDFEGSGGFGMQLVTMLASQLEGSIRIERENGTRVLLEFDL